MKTYIRFLRQGCLEVKAPPGFRRMNKKQQLEWAQKVLANTNDTDLLDAMSDYRKKDRIASNLGFFDAPPAACAVEVEIRKETKTLVQTKEWAVFTSADFDILLADTKPPQWLIPTR